MVRPEGSVFIPFHQALFARSGAGTWTFEENTLTAVDSPDNYECLNPWRGINVDGFAAGAGPVYFKNNTLDGSGTSTSTELPCGRAVWGVHIVDDVEDDAEMIFEGNTITGVQIGLKRDGGNLDLHDVLADNTFDPGSRVLGNKIRVPLENTAVYNVERDEYYLGIQEAIDDADPGNTIQVAPGTYHEYLFIEKPITLLGPNAGVPGYSAGRGPEAVLTVPKEVDLENPEDNMDAVIFVNASGVTVDGFRITGDNGNGKMNYAGCNIQAGIGIVAFNYDRMDNLAFQNNIIDCFSGMGVFTARMQEIVEIMGPIENVTVTGNLVRNIYDLRESGCGYGVYMQGTNGSATGNVVKNSRLGIMVHPISAGGGGLVKGNDSETYLAGLLYRGAESGAGAWTFEENSSTAIDPPDGVENKAFWRGIDVGYFTAGAGPVYFKNNTVDGSGTSVEHPYRSKVSGVVIHENVEDGAEMVFEGNTITGVQIGVERNGGNLDLHDVLDNNIFDPGSTVIENTIRVPEENTNYNVEKNEYYDSIQEAVGAPGDGNAVDGDPFIGDPRTYREEFAIPKIKNNLTLNGANSGPSKMEQFLKL